MFDSSAEAERFVHCFDPHTSLDEDASGLLVHSPRFGRIRRQHPLLATSPLADGPGAAWIAARHNLLTCRDHSVQRAIVTYQHRIRLEVRIALASLQDPAFDLHRHGHNLLDRYGEVRRGVVVRREAFFIRSLPPDPDGNARFEFGNTFLLPITEEAMLAESESLE
jgi:hypothetical protein